MCFFFSSRRRHTRCALVTGVQTCALPISVQGYIKRTPLESFRAQARGGKGRSGMTTKDEDAITELFVTSTHTPVLFFSTAGKVYRLKVWRLPEGGPATRGRPMVNLLPLSPGETIQTVLPLPEDEDSWKDLHVMFATANGTVRRNSMDAFANIPSNGKIAMRFDDRGEDRLIGVALLTDRKSTRLTPVTNAHLVCRLLLEKKNTKQKKRK